MDLFTMTNLEKKRVLLRAPVLTQSGYGVHARQIAKWLLSRKDLEVEVQVLPWGNTPWLIDSMSQDGLVGALMERTVDPSGRSYDASVQLQLPNEWDPALAKVNIGVTAGVETDRCNPEWIKACNAMSSVIVPSNHSADCIKRTGEVRVPLHIVPESYSEAISMNTRTSVNDLHLSTAFNFLVFGQITGNNPENDRKNIFYTLKWLCETFKNDEDVGIIIKTNAGRNTPIDRKLVTQTLTNTLSGIRHGKTPRVHLLHGDMTPAEVASLYRHPKIKCLVSLTRGEGYGLPILEAAASDLPVIATSWSGHTDFLSHGKYLEIDYKLAPIHPSRIDNAIFVQGARWAEASEEDFKRKVTKFRNASSMPKEWAVDLGKKIRELYSFDAISRRYDEVTKELL